MNKREAIKSWISRSVEAFRRVVEEEAQEGNDIAFDDRASSIVIIVFSALIGSYLVGHQTRSTGFFTATFGTLEMLLLYGALVFWIATSTLILIGRKNLSRDLDSFGGLFFVTVGNVWLLVVFPFEFAFFADLLPDFLRFLVKWISNDIARVLLALCFIVHLVFAVFSGILRVSVYKVRARKN